MRADKHTSRGAMHGACGALLTIGLLTAALLATAVLATSVSAPAALTRVTTTRVTSPRTSAHRSAALGWRVVATIGPGSQSVSGTLTAHAAKDAWSVWTGTRFTAVERLAGTGWTRVPLPARFSAYVRSAVAFDGDSATDFWLFSSYRRNQALRLRGTGWTLAPIPSWVLRAPSGGGGPSAVAAAFSPGDVWVFSLGAGSYAAHYDGRAWAKVSLPGVPSDVSALTADDIWALAAGAAMHWNGRTWARIKIPAAAVKPKEGFTSVAAAGPKSAWVVRTIAAAGPAVNADVLHWDGARWQQAGHAPADVIGSIVPDGSGGLWTAGLDISAGGFWNLYHLTDGHWTTVRPPAGVSSQVQEHLAWIPGTRSMWGTATRLTGKGSYGVIIKYGP